MSSSELCDWLLQATLASTAAIVLVLLLRKPMRAMFGPGVGYALWWLVPVATLASWLPPVSRVTAVPLLEPVASLSQVVHLATSDTAQGGHLKWVLLWWAGVMVQALWLAWQQTRFVASLGTLQHEPGAPGLLRAQSVAGLPAVIGVLHPRIVLPADVDDRYSLNQRHLMLAHEHAHMRHGDPWVNALVAVWRCVFWFNPLMHAAASRLRHDQELACDQRVLSAHPGARRAYADALFKTLVAAQPIPVACHWGNTHPVKERIMMLACLHTPRRRRLGLSLLVCAALGAGSAAWSAQPQGPVASDAGVTVTSQGHDYALQLWLRLDNAEPVAIALDGAYGEPFSVTGGSGERFEIAGSVTSASVQGKPADRIALNISRDGVSVASPVLVLERGKRGAVRIGTDTRDDQGKTAFEGLKLEVQLAPAAGASA